jgi:GNAT superfamily N-acetyltransferase
MPVELATPSDIPRLCELLAILFNQEAEFSPDPALQSQALHAILASPETGAILVMRETGTILGMVSLLYTVSTFLGGRVALLEDMVVDPAWRGQGHGRTLLQSAIEHARAAGCRRITLLTDEDNAPARAFYEIFGFAASAMRPFRLQLTIDDRSK